MLLEVGVCACEVVCSLFTLLCDDDGQRPGRLEKKKSEMGRWGEAIIGGRFNGHGSQFCFSC